jgi:putative aldouronate transport system substrate-binding protein
MDDWENMLTQFKTKLGATAPLDWSMNNSYNNSTLTNTAFIGTYGINYTYFIENSKVLFGPADPRYKDFLIEMAKWYKEGLIDPEIATNTQKTFDAKMCSNKSGAAAITFGGMMGKYIPQMASVDPNYKLVGVNYPVLKTGDFNRFYQTSNVIMQNGFISATSKNKEVAMAFLNYGFTPEGYILYNFGIEGQSFDWVNSYPKYTPLITKNPDGLSMQQAIMAYAWSSNNGDMVQDPRFTDQYMPFKEQSDALKTWTAAASKVTPMNSYLTQGRLTVDESSSITSSETQISTYRDEMVLKFMEGVQPINDSTWNTYIAQLKSLGLDNDLKVRQAAEDRFKKNNPSFYTAKGFSNPFDSYKNITK